MQCKEKGAALLQYDLSLSLWFAKEHVPYMFLLETGPPLSIFYPS